jgi:hypothetical protein
VARSPQCGSDYFPVLDPELVSPWVDELPFFGPVPDWIWPPPLWADPAWPFPGVELEPAGGEEPAPDGPVWACELEMPETEMMRNVAARTVKVRIGRFLPKRGAGNGASLRQLR